MTKTRLLALCLLAALGAAAADLKIKGDKYANWWVLGDTVTFKPEVKPTAEVKTITGAVFDSDSKELERHAVSAADFCDSGWSWRPKAPGFYTAKFSAVDAAGKESPLGASVTIAAGGKSKTFLLDGFGIGVLPSPTRKPADMPPQFGASLGWAMDGSAYHNRQMLMQARVAALMGAHAARLQCISLWDKTEPEPGKYDWHMVDWWLDTLKQEGFEDFAITLEGTAKCAVEKPDLTVGLIQNYLAQPPKDLKLWTDYITAIQTRYPFVKKWEIWNEPGNFPGQSCFWLGTPEEFCALLRAAYETLKRNQPDAQCFLGCALLGLHEHIIKTGFGKDYDAVSLHGKWPRVEPTRKLEEKPKPWANLEWHAILTSGSDYPYPSDKELAHNMLISFIRQLSLGAETVYVYGPLCGTGDMALLDFQHQNGSDWAHNLGLFSSMPSLQPRLPAVVWRNFSDLFSGDVKHLDNFASGVQAAALLDSAAGKVLLLWQNGKEPRKLDEQFAQALRPASTLLDWEGRKLDPASFVLKPAEIYFLKEPDMAAVSKWSSSSGQALRKYSLNSDAKAVELDNTVNGHYRQGRLFDAALNPLQAPLPWNAVAQYVALDGKPAPTSFTAKYAVSFDASGMDLLVVVKDPFHAPAPPDVAARKAFWEGDGVQIALDTKNSGLPDDKLELIAALMPDGPLLWKQKTPAFDGFLPSSNSHEQSLVKYAQTSIVREGDETIYKVHVPAGELYPFEYSQDRVVRCSLLVNRNDGAGRAGWLEWASGVGKANDPTQFGNLTVDIGGKTVLEQKDLSSRWGGASLAAGDGSAVVLSTEKDNAAAVSCKPFQLTPGGRYRVSFQARGDVPLQVMLNASKLRLDLLPASRLDGDWKSFELHVVIPTGFETATLSLFCYKSLGFFEIKNFEMAAD